MMPETTPAFDQALAEQSDRELLEYVVKMLTRLEPLLVILENPPPMMAALVPGLIDTSED